MRGVVEEPEGLRYLPELLSTEEEQLLLGRVRDLEYGEVRMHGQVARRTVRHYGLGYSFDSGELSPGEPVPPWLTEVRRRSAELLARHPEDLAEVLVTRYPPGATIGWHRDAPAFGDVVGVSLGSPCLLRFQRGTGTQRRVYEVMLQPGSAYVLSGRSRTVWQHSIPAVEQERLSVTLRTVRRGWRPS
ncbi:alpha-ketoglutarate-dependent dioxygenase AlkB [Pedococcus sp. 5OH_020]|uniref:alpha-ketoglutarate-dependent dioxygenase AlkB n=1 Tax=Pedococcus sp. 5OH_020 TaxID=2989814 RepID=UPI0022E9A2C2|nr:alpha-ketoglutarate-dependent dioxygenase AlkB [Pedococcus sp. 5OH_020]